MKVLFPLWYVMGVSKTCAWEDRSVLTTLEIRDVGQQMHISEIQVLLSTLLQFFENLAKTIPFNIQVHIVSKSEHLLGKMFSFMEPAKTKF